MQARHEPVFNVPFIIVATLAVLVFVHAVRALVLSPQQDIEFLQLFAFIPARYAPSLLPGGGYPGGRGAEIWTFFTYSLIHADLLHLGVNIVWLLPFGTAVARRFGPARYVAFFAVTAAFAALAHLVTNSGASPMVGASGAISGMMAAAMRFVFERGGPLGFLRDDSEQSYWSPAPALGGALRDPRVLMFAAVWFGSNLLLGAFGSSFIGAGNVAWQAHIGGFLAGLFLFPLFDPIAPARASAQPADSEPTPH